jgi:hypothetical protein
MKCTLQPFVCNGRHPEIRAEMRTRTICRPELAGTIAIHNELAFADRCANHGAAPNPTRGCDGVPAFANHVGIGKAS